MITNAMYHVSSRGNRRSDIFKEEEDYLVYLGDKLMDEKEEPKQELEIEICLQPKLIEVVNIFVLWL